MFFEFPFAAMPGLVSDDSICRFAIFEAHLCFLIEWKDFHYSPWVDKHRHQRILSSSLAPHISGILFIESTFLVSDQTTTCRNPPVWTSPRGITWVRRHCFRPPCSLHPFPFRPRSYVKRASAVVLAKPTRRKPLSRGLLAVNHLRISNHGLLIFATVVLMLMHLQ